MGKVIESILAERNHRVVARIDPVTGDGEELTPVLAEKADCAIEFTVPDAVVANARFYSEHALTAVVGTTGWFDELPTVENLVKKRKMAYLYGSNFSIGAQLFFRLVKSAALMVNPFPEYGMLGFEVHHKRKKDSPSGTALEIARIILENSQRKNALVTEKLDRPVKENELHFASLRGGEFPGIHKVFIDSAADTIELTHTARNRKGFALGAVLAAEWVQGRKGFYKVDDFIDDIISETNSQ